MIIKEHKHIFLAQQACHPAATSTAVLTHCRAPLQHPPPPQACWASWCTFSFGRMNHAAAPVCKKFKNYLDAHLYTTTFTVPGFSRMSETNKSKCFVSINTKRSCVDLCFFCTPHCKPLSRSTPQSQCSWHHSATTPPVCATSLQQSILIACTCYSTLSKGCHTQRRSGCFGIWGNGVMQNGKSGSTNFLQLGSHTMTISSWKTKVFLPELKLGTLQGPNAGQAEGGQATASPDTAARRVGGRSFSC